MPLLVRGGAILPLGPVVQHSGERPLDEVTLQIYPEGTSRFELYEDDGRSNAYRRGQYALTPIECAATPGRITVRIETASGDRSVVAAGRRYVLRLRVARPAAVTVDGAELPRVGGDTGGDGWWVDDAGFLAIRPPARPSLTVVVTT